MKTTATFSALPRFQGASQHGKSHGLPRRRQLRALQDRSSQVQVGGARQLQGISGGAPAELLEGFRGAALGEEPGDAGVAQLQLPELGVFRVVEHVLKQFPEKLQGLQRPSFRIVDQLLPACVCHDNI